MKYRLSALIVGVLVLGALPVLAHHNFASTFDWTRPVVMTGTVTSVEYAAPHVKVFVDVRDARGDRSAFVLELGSPDALAKYGWSKNTLLTGEQVTFAGWLARDDGRFISAKSITTSGGRELFGASSFFDIAGSCVSAKYCIDDEVSSR